MMHKDLSDEERDHIEWTASSWAHALLMEGQSLAIARECWINAFDKAAEELDVASSAN